MKSLPTGIQCTIDKCLHDHTRPLCVVLDSHFIVQSWSGDFSYYGFDGLETGKDCRDTLLFLVGLNAEDSLQLRFIETPNNRSVHLHMFIKDGQTILVLLDASEQRVSHAFLQQKSNELALMQIEQLRLIEELKRMKNEIEAKRLQAEQANQLKSRFIATMSHEFRTPLTSIMGYALRLKSIDRNEARVKYSDSIEKSAKHLLSLVENLLDHAQIESGSMSINPIATDVKAVMDKLSSIFEPLAEDKSLEFEFRITSDIPDYLCLDEMRFRQVLVNLISNAIKYTNEGGVLVETSWMDDELTVSVEDTGKGIAQNDQQRIFAAFEQLGNESGIGLGLSIVKYLVTAMNGSLTLDSILGKGSRFTIRFPAMMVEVDSDSCQSERTKDRPHRKQWFLDTVLIVEDDLDIMRLLQIVFEEMGCRCLVAQNGNDALNLALTELPDLVMMDLNLPDITGLNVIKSLRSNQFLNPVFVQSAWVFTEYKAKAIDAGCDEYLLKPFDLSYLTTLVSRYFLTKHDLGMPVERYRQIYRKFLDSLPEKQIALQQLERKGRDLEWNNSVRKDLHTYIHRLAGSADLYGMNSIARASKRLDQLLLDYECIDMRVTHVELRNKINNMIFELNAQFDHILPKK